MVWSSRLYGCGGEISRGKSELHTAGCRLTDGEGDFKESATENYRQFMLVRMKRRGKSSPLLRRRGRLCKPHPEQDRGGP